jgi:hypothetical protein
MKTALFTAPYARVTWICATFLIGVGSQADGPWVVLAANMPYSTSASRSPLADGSYSSCCGFETPRRSTQV